VLSEAYGTEAIKKLTVFEWHKLSKECQENMEGTKNKVITIKTYTFSENVEKCQFVSSLKVKQSIRHIM
jgi:hypothetical protein